MFPTQISVLSYYNMKFIKEHTQFAPRKRELWRNRDELRGCALETRPNKAAGTATTPPPPYMQTRVEKHCGTHPAQEIHLVGGKKQQRRDTFEGARTHTQTDTAALTTCCVHPHLSNEPALSPRVMVVTLTRKERANRGCRREHAHSERAEAERGVAWVNKRGRNAVWNRECENKRRKAEKWLCQSVCECMQARRAGAQQSAVGVSTLAPRERCARTFGNAATHFPPWWLMLVGARKYVVPVIGWEPPAGAAERPTDWREPGRELRPRIVHHQVQWPARAKALFSLSPPVCSAGCRAVCAMLWDGWAPRLALERSLARSLLARRSHVAPHHLGLNPWTRACTWSSALVQRQPGQGLPLMATAPRDAALSADLIGLACSLARGFVYFIIWVTHPGWVMAIKSPVVNWALKAWARGK